jgi:hypothetical protein
MRLFQNPVGAQTSFAMEQPLITGVIEQLPLKNSRDATGREAGWDIPDEIGKGDSFADGMDAAKDGGLSIFVKFFAPQKTSRLKNDTDVIF